jgi:2-C-methyl-D-erythritol 4-phosphate cytidylyltransferase
MKQKKVIAIVPAAGIGKRFGEGRNKTFQELRGKHLLIWALEVLDSVDEIKEIIPVLKEEHLEKGLEIIERSGISKVRRIAPGGKERQDSVFNGLSLINNKPDAVLIHDGARPLIEKKIVEEAIQKLLIPPPPPLVKGGKGGFDGVIVGVPVKDTIKKVSSFKFQVSSEIFVQKTLDRKSLWAIQTPQVFKYPSLMKAYKKAMSEGFYSTDDSAIVERYGGRIKVIMGSYENIKITTPEDLDIAEMFLRRKTQSDCKP